MSKQKLRIQKIEILPNGNCGLKIKTFERFYIEIKWTRLKRIRLVEKSVRFLQRSVKRVRCLKVY